MKKKKSKAQKKIERQRKDFLRPEPDFNPEKSIRDFTQLVWYLVDDILSIDDVTPGDIKDVQILANMCRIGWNAAVSFESEDEAMDFLESSLPPDVTGMERDMLLDICQSTVYMKYERFPKDSVLFEDARVGISGGDLVINPVPDYEDLENMRAMQSKTASGTIEEILDFEALKKSVEGLPEDQADAVLKREIAAQIEKYNNTPNAKLGDLSPDETYEKKRNRPG